jgi:hypothetical protein
MDWLLVAGTIGYLLVTGFLLYLTYGNIKKITGEGLGLATIVACVFWPITLLIFLIALGLSYLR